MGGVVLRLFIVPIALTKASSRFLSLTKSWNFMRIPGGAGVTAGAGVAFTTGLAVAGAALVADCAFRPDTDKMKAMRIQGTADLIPLAVVLRFTQPSFQWNGSVPTLAQPFREGEEGPPLGPPVDAQADGAYPQAGLPVERTGLLGCGVGGAVGRLEDHLEIGELGALALERLELLADVEGAAGETAVPGAV